MLLVIAVLIDVCSRGLPILLTNGWCSATPPNSHPVKTANGHILKSSLYNPLQFHPIYVAKFSWPVIMSDRCSGFHCILILLQVTSTTQKPLRIQLTAMAGSTLEILGITTKMNISSLLTELKN